MGMRERFRVKFQCRRAYLSGPPCQGLFFGNGILLRSKGLLRACDRERQVYSKTIVRPSPRSIFGDFPW